MKKKIFFFIFSHNIDFGYPQPMFSSLRKMSTNVHPSHRHVILMYHLVVILDVGETQYARALRSYRPMSGRSLRLYKGTNTSHNFTIFYIINKNLL